MICILKWLTSLDFSPPCVWLCFLCVFLISLEELALSRISIMRMIRRMKSDVRFKEFSLWHSHSSCFPYFCSNSLLSAFPLSLLPPSPSLDISRSFATFHAEISAPHPRRSRFLSLSPGARSHAHRLLNVTIYFNDNESKWWSRDKSSLVEIHADSCVKNDFTTFECGGEDVTFFWCERDVLFDGYASLNLIEA